MFISNGCDDHHKFFRRKFLCYKGFAGPKLGALVAAPRPTKITMPSPPGLDTKSCKPLGFQLFAAHKLPAISAFTDVRRIKGK